MSPVPMSATASRACACTASETSADAISAAARVTRLMAKSSSVRTGFYAVVVGATGIEPVMQ